MKTTDMEVNPVRIESSDISDVGQVHNFSKIFGARSISDFNLIRFIVSPNRLSDLDQHQVKEYWYFAKGNGILFIDDLQISAKEGELYFFDSFVTHQVKNISSDTALEILSIWW